MMRTGECCPAPLILQVHPGLRPALRDDGSGSLDSVGCSWDGVAVFCPGDRGTAPDAAAGYRTQTALIARIFILTHLLHPHRYSS